METNVAAQTKGLMELMLHYVERVCDRIDEEGERFEKYVEREPGRALCLALGAGAILGLLVKRR